jgi:hypothetical protein
MDRYRCKLEGYPDGFFQEAFGGNDEEESAANWLEAFHKDYPQTKDMKVGNTFDVIVETNEKTRTRVRLCAALYLHPIATTALGN